MATQEGKTRDRWDKIDILLKPVGGLLTGIALAIVGYFTTDVLEKQQAAETNRRLYAEIMSSREKADSDLRKEMFNAIISAFLNPESATLEEKVLALELLAYNFHDVIDLSPLFKHVARSIETFTGDNRDDLRDQLERVAREVIDKQLAALGDAGMLIPLSLSFEEVDNGTQSFNEHLFPIRSDLSTEDDEKRYIFIEALHQFPETQEIKLRLESGSPGNRFNPEIDNTRLSHSQRIAVALTRWTDYGAELALVYFPGSRASLKEKPYYDEVIEQLQLTQLSFEERHDEN